MLLQQHDPLDDFESTLTQILPGLPEIMEADGVTFLNEETVLHHGQVPCPDEVSLIGATLGNDLVVTDSLFQDFPRLAHLHSLVSGLISIPLGPRSRLMIFRKATCPWPPFTGDLIDDLNTGLSGLLVSRNKVLESSNEELRHFASVIAHEVKSQLQAPLMALSIIEERNNGDEKTTALTDVGISALTTLTGLTSEMLSFAQHDINLTDLSEVNFDEIARSALDQSLSSQNGLKVQTIVQKFPTFSASPHQSHHVFLNLIRNALIHGPADQQDDFRLEIGAKLENDKHVFFVRDNGQGIHPDDHEKIFEYFQRGSHSTNRKGSGIGLAFIRRLLERSGGDIRVESQPGKGSTFYFTIGNKTEGA